MSFPGDLKHEHTHTLMHILYTVCSSLKKDFSPLMSATVEKMRMALRHIIRNHQLNIKKIKYNYKV